MSPPRVDQLLAGYADGDAISQEARLIRDIARTKLGIESEIFVPPDRIGSGVSRDCRPIGEYRGAKEDLALYHYATASSISALFRALPARRLVRYHNITPAPFFDGFDDAVAGELRQARSELAAVAACAESVWAVSEFNAGDVRAAGVNQVSVMPLLFSPDDFAAVPDPGHLGKFSRDLTNILFVGRMAPNKCVEELILAFAWYFRTINERSRLILVGSERSCPRYYAMVRMLASQLGLANVCFEGFLSREQLAACYRAAHVFVCASRHEGYCLPLLEAVSHGVPVVARASGGMPEALGGSGVLFDGDEPRMLAELIARVAADAALRGEVLDSQTRRLSDLRKRDLAADCRRMLALA